MRAARLSAGSFGRVLSSRTSFVLLVAVAVAALGIGSHHPSVPSAAARIAHLEQIIKCPSCTDESIAQSNASTAVGLRLKVVAMVREGYSDQAIEAYAVAQYPGGEILVPTGGLTTLEWAFPLGALILAALGLLVVLARRRDPERKRASEADEAMVAAARGSVAR